MTCIIAEPGMNHNGSLDMAIELIIYDFDGVSTNTKVYVDQNGVESVVCDCGDCLGVQMLR